MAEAPDWSGLEKVAHEVHGRLVELQQENRALRRKLKKAGKDLEAARASPPPAELATEVATRLERLAGEVEGLLKAQEPAR